MAVTRFLDGLLRAGWCTVIAVWAVFPPEGQKVQAAIFVGLGLWFLTGVGRGR